MENENRILEFEVLWFRPKCHALLEIIRHLNQVPRHLFCLLDNFAAQNSEPGILMRLGCRFGEDGRHARLEGNKTTTGIQRDLATGLGLDSCVRKEPSKQNAEVTLIKGLGFSSSGTRALQTVADFGSTAKLELLIGLYLSFRLQPEGFRA